MTTTATNSLWQRTEPSGMRRIGLFVAASLVLHAFGVLLINRSGPISQQVTSSSRFSIELVHHKWEEQAANGDVTSRPETKSVARPTTPTGVSDIQEPATARYEQAEKATETAAKEASVPSVGESDEQPIAKNNIHTSARANQSSAPGQPDGIAQITNPPPKEESDEDVKPDALLTSPKQFASETQAASAPRMAPPSLARKSAVGKHEDQLIVAIAQRLQSLLSEQLVYPLRARRRGWEGEVLLGFRIDRNGKFQDVKILRSSGYGLLDRAAIRALEKTEELIQPFLLTRLSETLAMELPVGYRLVD